MLAAFVPKVTGAHEILSYTCPKPTQYDLWGFTPSMAVGLGLVVVGGTLRVLCFRELGKFFTFKITIRPNHKLVDSGPYGIVRHPGYTACLFLIGGGIILVSGPSNYLDSCGITTASTLLQQLRYLWTVHAVYTVGSLLRRGPFEDRQLHAQFGKVWEEYAQRVPYWYIPGLI